MSETESKPKNAPQQETGGDCNPRLVLPSLGDLLENWYEGSAYGEHVPKELPKLVVDFIEEHGMRVITEETAWEIISETSAEQSWWKLFECIFEQGMKYTMLELENRELLRENAEVRHGAKDADLD